MIQLFEAIEIHSELLASFLRKPLKILREPNILTERPPLVGEVSAKFEDRGRILDFLDRSRYFFFQVAPHLYSRG
jgi:hypothetical protein